MVGKSIQESSKILGSFDTDFINLSTSGKLDEIGKGGFRKIVIFLRLQQKVIKIIITKKYDLYYMTLTSSGAGFYKDFLVLVIFKLFRKKVIFHFHNKGVSKNQDKKIQNLLYKFTFRNTKAILLSQNLYQDIQKYVKPEDVFICPNGIPEIKTISAIIKKDTSKVCKLLFLSNMMEEKGVYILLEACNILKVKNINFECHFIGAWSDITEIDFKTKVEQLDLSESVFCHGKKYNEEKDAYFLNSDIFVFPTFYSLETFGLVNLEAMQYSLPIISTPEGGIPDIVIDGETGFLVPQKDALALADKIEFLISNPELRRKMGASGRKRYEEHFTLEKFENRMVEILKQAIEA